MPMLQLEAFSLYRVRGSELTKIDPHYNDIVFFIQPIRVPYMLILLLYICSIIIDIGVNDSYPWRYL